VSPASVPSWRRLRASVSNRSASALRIGLTHHAQKAGDEYRGSTAIGASHREPLLAGVQDGGAALAVKLVAGERTRRGELLFERLDAFGQVVDREPQPRDHIDLLLQPPAHLGVHQPRRAARRSPQSPRSSSPR